MVMNTGILRDVHADEYGFGIGDLAVAAMLKAYLQQLKEDAAVETLSRIVTPGAVSINTEELAVLIDNARAVAAISADAWQAQEGEVRMPGGVCQRETGAFCRAFLFAEIFLDFSFLTR